MIGIGMLRRNTAGDQTVGITGQIIVDYLLIRDGRNACHTIGITDVGCPVFNFFIVQTLTVFCCSGCIPIMIPFVPILTF